MSGDWRLIQEHCTGCGICADVCLEQAILLTRQMAYPQPVALRCTACMSCVVECPFGAIEVREKVRC